MTRALSRRTLASSRVSTVSRIPPRVRNTLHAEILCVSEAPSALILGLTAWHTDSHFPPIAQVINDIQVCPSRPELHVARTYLLHVRLAIAIALIPVDYCEYLVARSCCEPLQAIKWKQY